MPYSHRGTTNSALENLVGAGRWIFAIAIAAFGTQQLAHLVSATFPAPGPPVNWAGAAGTVLAGILLLGAAAAILLNLPFAEWAVMLLASLFVLRAFVVDVPGIFANPHKPGPWTGGFELLALAGACLVLAALLSANSVSAKRGADWRSLAGRILFGLMLLVIAVQHFLYAEFLATLIPSWLPWHLFWAEFVGAAFIAAAVAIMTRQKIWLGASLLGLLFFLFVVTLHIPRVLGKMHDGNEWTSMLVALAMCGGSLIIAIAASAGVD